MTAERSPRHRAGRHRHGVRRRSRRRDIHRIAGLYWPHRRRIGWLLLLILTSTLLSLSSPFLLRAIVDVAIPGRKLDLLSLLVAAMLAVALVNSIIGLNQSTITINMGQRIAHRLRTSVYTNLQQLSLGFYTRIGSGEVQSRIANDVGGVQGFLTMTTSAAITGGTAVVATLTAMFALEWHLALVSVLLLPFLIRLSRRTGMERRRLFKIRQESIAKMTGEIEQSLSVDGIILGRTLGRSRSLISNFSLQSADVAEIGIRSALTGRWRMAVLRIALSSLPPAIYFIGGSAVVSGFNFVTLGTIVAFVSLQNALLGPLLSLIDVGVQWQSNLALFRRIFEFTDERPEVSEKPGALGLPRSRMRGEVIIDHVSFAYSPGGRSVLSDVCLEVPAGTSLALVGATGSGKSTLAHLIPRLYDPVAGRILFDGIDIRDLSFDTLSTAFGVISQNTFLRQGSIIGNLRFARSDATTEEIISACKVAGIHDRIVTLPDQYETVVGTRGVRFSGGERQRLAIARAILRDPPVLVLDEATSALDNVTERAVQAALDNFSAGRTTITIAHRLSTVRHSDRIAVVHDGRIVEYGSHDVLVALGGRYAKLLNATYSEVR